MKIEAAVTYSDSPGFHIETVEIEPPRADEILVRIVGVGLCHTDLVASSGALGLPAPMVLGHEGSGVVEQVGADVTKVVPGDAVVLTFRSCGRCRNCGRGDPAYCRHSVALNITGRRADGSTALRSPGGRALAGHFFGQSSFATHALACESNVVKIDAAAPLELLGPLGCGVQTGVGAILRSLDCPTGSSLLILGGGSVGLSAVMAAKMRGCAPVIVLEPVAARRALALTLGATHALDPADTADLAQTVGAMVPDGIDYVFDTTGLPKLQSAGLACLASKGVMGIAGVTPPGVPPPGEMRTVMRAGLTIRGIVEGDSDPDIFIPQMIDWFLAGQLPFDRMIRTYPLEQINEAIDDHKEGRCIKAVLLTGDVARG